MAIMHYSSVSQACPASFDISMSELHSPCCKCQEGAKRSPIPSMSLAVLQEGSFIITLESFLRVRQ